MTTKAKYLVAELKTAYVQDKLYTLIIVLLLQLGLLTGLGGFIFYQLNTVPKPIIFQATERKQVIRPLPLDDPAMSSAAVLNWVVEAIRVSYSFNYRSINNHIDKISPYFDNRGLTKFFEIVVSEPNMRLVKADKLIVSMHIKEAPKIVREGKINGRYAWRIALPIELRYENSIILKRQELDIDLYVWRVPETEAPIGIKITNFNIKVKKNFLLPETVSN